MRLQPARRWRSFRALRTDHPPTQFKHQPHLSLSNENRCSTCHWRDEKEFKSAKREFEATYEGFKPGRGFVSRCHSRYTALCATCHTEAAAGEACVSCDNYHWGDFTPVYLSEGP